MIPGLYPTFYERTLSGAVLNLPELEWSVGEFASSTEGGPVRATVTARGSVTVLKLLAATLLRCPVIIKDKRGRQCWWGYVDDTSLQAGSGVEVGYSLDEMANAVACAYIFQGSGVYIAGERATTAWAEDADSITEYGRKELMISLSDATHAEAEQARDNELAERRLPLPLVSLTSGKAGTLELTLFGHFETYGWRYYSQASGTTSSENEPTTLQSIGRAAIGPLTTLSFNNAGGKWTIHDSANGLDGLSVGEYIVISGSSFNNRTTRVLEVAEDGSYIEVSDEMFVEAAGASITLSPRDTEAAQSFRLDDQGEGNYFLHTVRIKARTVDAGHVDSLRVTLKADSAGTPGATIATATVTAASVPLDFDWLDFRNWDVVAELVPLTSYWLVIDRTGADAAACYQIALDETAEYLAGTGIFWNGAAWQPFRDSEGATIGADVPFVVVGAWDLETQIEKVAAASSFVTTVVIEDASSSYSLPARDGDTTGLQVMRGLLRAGTSAEGRYLAEVLPTDGTSPTLRVYREPSSVAVDDLHLTLEGKILDHRGREVEPWLLSSIIGHWCHLPPDLLDGMHDGRTLEPSPFFIDGASYRPGAGGGLSITPRGARDPYDDRPREG